MGLHLSFNNKPDKVDFYSRTRKNNFITWSSFQKWTNLHNYFLSRTINASS